MHGDESQPAPNPAADRLRVWLVCDGKPGHENQSLGLAEALARRVPCAVERIEIGGPGGLRARWRAAVAAAAALPRPDLVIGAGHPTHGILWWLARRAGVPAVVLMRPSLPPWLFDFVIAPDHDYPVPPRAAGRVLATRGAINRVRPQAAAAAGRVLILLGGPSKHHGWNSEKVRSMVARIASGGGGEVEIADSRRTPAGFLDSLHGLAGVRAVHGHQSTPSERLAGWIAGAEQVWITEDSVSMIYEALSAGARVGLLPVERLRPRGRLIAGLEKLAAEGWITRFDEWKPGQALAAAPEVLAEADRAADWLLTRLETRRIRMAKPAGRP